MVHTVLNTVADLIVVYDKDARIIEFNKECEKITGYTFDEVKGKDFRELFITDEELPKINAGLELLKKNPALESANYWKTKTGKLRLINWNNSVTYSGEEIEQVKAFGSDITETREAFSAIMESAQRMLMNSNSELPEIERAQEVLHFTQFSVDKASDAVFWVDENAKFLYVNEVASKIFGYSREEMLNMHVYDLEISPNAKNNWPKFWEHIRQIKTALVESKVRRKDGSIFPLEINTSYFKFRDKEIKVSYARDITERKKSEEKIKSINHDLSTFIYRSTHDLKAPLATLAGVINLAKSELPDPTAQQYLQLIEKCAGNLNNILLMLIQAMQVKDNKITADWIKVDKILGDVMDRLQFISGFKNIDFRINNSLTDFYTDGTLLASLLQNIIENAVKFQDSSAPFPYVIIEISAENDKMRLKISDNGIGIEEKLQPHIFDMFYRATLDTKGSGLGLYIVKSIVEKLNGEIIVKSIEGGGTSMNILLPPADKV